MPLPKTWIEPAPESATRQEVSTPNEGRQDAANSQAVVLSNEDLAALVNRGSVFFAPYETLIANAATYNHTTRDIGVAVGAKTPYSYYNVFAVTDRSGLLVVEVSSDGATWRKAAEEPASVGVPLTISIPVIAKYFRWRFTNSGGVQTYFFAADSFTQG